jgi:hypothetical protein
MAELVLAFILGASGAQVTLALWTQEPHKAAVWFAIFAVAMFGRVLLADEAGKKS